MKQLLLKTYMVIATLTYLSVASAQNDNRTESYNPAHVSMGILGWDPVSFFSTEGPVLGDIKITLNYKGVNYLFSSEENRAQFLSNPNKYEPTYGGWCAWAMADNTTVPIDPKYYSFDYSGLGEKIRIHFFVNERPMQNFNNRRVLRSNNASTPEEISILTIEEIASLVPTGGFDTVDFSDSEVRAASIVATYKFFQDSADKNWFSRSQENPKFSNGN